MTGSAVAPAVTTCCTGASSSSSSRRTKPPSSVSLSPAGLATSASSSMTPAAATTSTSSTTRSARSTSSTGMSSRSTGTSSPFTSAGAVGSAVGVALAALRDAALRGAVPVAGAGRLGRCGGRRLSSGRRLRGRRGGRLCRRALGGRRLLRGGAGCSLAGDGLHRGRLRGSGLRRTRRGRRCSAVGRLRRRGLRGSRPRRSRLRRRRLRRSVVVAFVFVPEERVVVGAEAVAFFVVRVVAAATREVARSLATAMPCSSSARRTTRPRLARTSAARSASATCSPVTEPVVLPLRTRDWRALWENSGGSALDSEGFVDTGDTDYLSSRMAAVRGRVKRHPGAARRVLCDTASTVR